MATITGSATMCLVPYWVSLSAMTVMNSGEETMPIFIASGKISVNMASSSAAKKESVAYRMSVTPAVFWAVKAVTAVMVLMSAWIPAPPLESLPAIDNAALIVMLLSCFILKPVKKIENLLIAQSASGFYETPWRTERAPPACAARGISNKAFYLKSVSALFFLCDGRWCPRSAAFPGTAGRENSKKAILSQGENGRCHGMKKSSQRPLPPGIHCVSKKCSVPHPYVGITQIR